MKENIRIGYACTPISIPYRTSRSFLLKNFNEQLFGACTSDNLKDLMSILQWNSKNGIRLFRISSDIIPFGSHPANQLKWWDSFHEDLIACGEFIRKNNMRVSMHPGQYTVLNSPKEDVVQKSIEDLEYHCRFLDALQVDYTNKIVLHVGGVYGDKPAATTRFLKNFDRLSISAKKRLVLENDDKSYSVDEVLRICDGLGIPTVFDNLHQRLNPCRLAHTEILSRVRDTWKETDGPMKLHYSDQDAEKQGGAHSKSVNTLNFLSYVEALHALDFNADIMLEVKDKELSALKCIYSLAEELPARVRTSQWAKYKYCLMERNYAFYKICSGMVNSGVSMRDIYGYIDECIACPVSEGSFVNTAQHVYGYVKDKTTTKEKAMFQELLRDPDNNQQRIKHLLQRLCSKYESQYMKDSYYFIY